MAEYISGEFFSGFWSWFIGIATILSILGCFALVYWMTYNAPKRGGQAETTEHVWDEDLREYNNPMPGWWMNMFYITLVFSLVYLLLYPGLGTFKGLLNWSQTKQYQEEVKTADARFAPLFAKFQSDPIPALAKNPEALKTGERLFLNYCTTCHGSDARGSQGFPNLRDQDWLYGGAPEMIEASILNGRNGVMPDKTGNGLTGPDDLNNVTQYVLSLSGREGVDAAAAAKGKAKYFTICFVCHGPEGKGNPAMGAPNLTDDIWLHGASPGKISETISKGRKGMMPAHKEFLGEAKVHLLAAYVYSLSAK
ncbi:MAG: cytochrome-c oxidase, cbb3-type subunit III [Gammaproteobacteria bacterium]|nr:cytochrome-c oxidase, cbb3-type subunit III [Gammaproteobacteria bacterium]